MEFSVPGIVRGYHVYQRFALVVPSASSSVVSVVSIVTLLLESWAAAASFVDVQGLSFVV